MHHLAEVLQAEELFREELEKRSPACVCCGRSVHGHQHEETLSSSEDFAEFLKERGRLEEAEELYRQVLESRRVKLGDEHADTMSSISDLATLLKEKEEWKEAEQLFCDKLKRCQSVHGTQHKETITATKKLAKFLKERGRQGEAEELLSSLS
ncbi:klc-2 [Symbiodinium sp. KB8]|nr:klc-2 [Symbiodinium sp. KB8]